MKRFLAILTTLAVFACTPGEQPEQPSDSIKVSPASVSDISHEGAPVSLSVEANCSYRLTLTDEEGKNVSWMTADKTSASGSGTIQITVAANPLTTPRRGSVNIIGNTVSAFVDIYQQARPVTPDPEPEPEPDPEPDPDPEPEPEPDPGFKGFYEMPVYEQFVSPRGLDVPSGTSILMDPDFSNLTIEGNRVIFDQGLIIEKTGADGKYQMGLPIHVNPKYMAGFQLGIHHDNFSKGDAWIIKIPMKEDLWGDLRFSYDSRRESISTSDPYSWSSDEGVTWHPVTKMEGMKSEAACKSIWFTIPEAEKVSAGKALWIKIVPDSTTPRLQSGIMLNRAEAPLSELPAQDKSKVVLSEGFDAIVGANASWLDAPGFLKSHSSGKTDNTGTDISPYVPANSAIAVLHAFARPGFLQMGSQDESLIAYCGWNGTLSLKVGERLKEMGVEKADLTVTFRAAGMTSAYQRPTDAKVILMRGETVIGRIDSLTPDKFVSYSFDVKDADQSTVLVLTSEDSSKPDQGQGDNPYVMADYRFFVDDILVTLK